MPKVERYWKSHLGAVSVRAECECARIATLASPRSCDAEGGVLVELGDDNFGDFIATGVKLCRAVDLIGEWEFYCFSEDRWGWAEYLGWI